MYNRIPVKKPVDLSAVFIEVYRAYPAMIIGRDDIELSNSIILPPSALDKLSYMKNFGDSRNPVLFRILNIQLNIYTHCGVVEFTAEEGTCYLPFNMFDKLNLEEGSKVNIRNIVLKPGTYIKLRPHKTEFINNPQPKTVLEYNLENYFCVTEGDTISVKFRDKIYKIDVIECKPEKQIRTLNCNLQVDFEEPIDYKEYQEKHAKKPQNITGNNIILKPDQIPVKLTKEQIQKQIMDNKFRGHHMRIDGKDVSNNQAKKIIKSKIELQNKEDNYDPRKCRISSNPRTEFKYVEL